MCVWICGMSERIVGVTPDTFVKLDILVSPSFRTHTHGHALVRRESQEHTFKYRWEIWSAQQLQTWTQTHEITHRLCFLTVTRIVLAFFVVVLGFLVLFILFFVCVFVCSVQTSTLSVLRTKKRDRERAWNMNASVNVSASSNSWCVFLCVFRFFFSLQWFYSFVCPLYTNFFSSIGLLSVNKR